MGIYEKLAKVQAVLADTQIKANATNPFLKNKYADLPSIMAIVGPVLAEHGMIVVHGGRGGEALCTALVDVETGEKVESSLPIMGDTMQQAMGSVTYARRYNITCLLDLQIDKDDDGNKASGTGETSTSSRRSSRRRGVS